MEKGRLIEISMEDLDYIFDTLYKLSSCGAKTDLPDEVEMSLELIDDAFKLDRNK